MAHVQSDRTPIIAVCGKGGVGKTSISALITKLLLEQQGSKVLAIDADPAVGLATALGVEVVKTVDDVRKQLIGLLEKGQAGDRHEMLAMLDYEMLSAMEESGRLAFLAIGRPENEGCYCQVNHILKDIIASIAAHFDYVVIDGEAGVEQVNRRVMEKVSHLLLVSDASLKGLNVVQTIKEVSDETIDYLASGLVINKLKDESEQKGLSLPPQVPYLGWMPEEETIRQQDIKGHSFLDLAHNRALESLRGCIEKLGFIAPSSQ